MSYTVAVWALPAGAAPPADLAAADALLAAQRAAGPTGWQNPRFLDLGRALYDRFAPQPDACDDLEAWLDGSEEGTCDRPVLVFGLRSGRLFEAAYRHAVVQARALGLNLHDPQSGEHHLADGRRLPDGEPITARSADIHWHNLDWRRTVADLRRAAAQGSAEAVHDLGRCLLDGLLEDVARAHAAEPMRVAGVALMELAAAPDPFRSAARQTARLALPAAWRLGLLPALLARWDGMPPLQALDSALAEHAATRQRLQPMWNERRAWTPDSLGWLRSRGDAAHGPALRLLAHQLETEPELLAHLGWAPPPGRARQVALLAAESGDVSARLRAAECLLAGEHGWPLDPVAALSWLRRVPINRLGRLHEVVDRLSQRLAAPWDTQGDRAQAQALLTGLDRLPAAAQLAQLRRCCTLDHPAAWRRLGDAYLQGELGLPALPTVGVALHLHAAKRLAGTASDLPRAVVARWHGVRGVQIDDAVHLAQLLVGVPDPWPLIDGTPDRMHQRAQMQNMVDDLQSAARRRRSREQGEAAPPARQAAGVAQPAAATRSPARSSARSSARVDDAPELPPLPSALLLLWLGVAGQVLLLMFVGRLGARAMDAGLLLCALPAVLGGWRCGPHLGWQGATRLCAALAAGLPMVGLFVAARLSHTLWLRHGGD